MDRLVVAAGEVTPAGPFDLDHPGAEVGELAGGERGRHRLLQRDHQHPLQRQGPQARPFLTIRGAGFARFAHGAGFTRFAHGATEFRLMSWRAMTLRWISLVPSPTIIRGASRK